MEQVALESKKMKRVHILIVLGVFAKLRKVIILASSRLSVRPHGRNWVPLDGLPLNLIFKYFSKIYHENLSVIKIRKK